MPINGWADFWRAARHDLALPTCLALVWSLARQKRDQLPSSQKAALARDFDRLLGLDFGKPPIRHAADPFRGAVSSPRAIAPTPASESAYRVSVNLLVQPGEDLAAVERCVRSVVRHCGQLRLEVVVVDATGSPASHAELVAVLHATADAGMRIVWLDHDSGAGAGRNAGLRASTGEIVVLMDASIELTGDALAPVVAALDDPAIGAAGAFGLITRDLRHFADNVPAPDDPPATEVDALQNYLLAFRRRDLPRIEPLDEHFRFYRILDLDLSYTIRTRVGRLVSLAGLPLVEHRHTLWEALDETERDQRSRQNFAHFLKRWGHRRDLLRAADARRERSLAATPAVHG